MCLEGCDVPVFTGRVAQAGDSIRFVRFGCTGSSFES